MKRKALWAITAITAIWIMTLPGLCKADIKIGGDWMYGKDVLLPDAWQSPSCENTVNRFSIRAETNEIFPSLDKWFFGIEGMYSMHKADEKPEGSYWMGHDAGFREYSFNVTISRQMFDDLLYVKWIMGLSYWHNRDVRSHNLGDSHCLGTWGPAIGKDWNLYKTWSLRTEFRMTHTSDPFRSDRGKNYGTFMMGVTYTFKGE